MWIAALVGAGILAAVGGALTRVDPHAGPCVMQTAPVPLPDLAETSGLAVSRRHPGILWTHNDSGNEPVLNALDATGAIRGRVRLPIQTRDWEDISYGRCADTDCLYVGDIGDNGRARGSVRIYRLSEPALEDVEAPQPELFTVKYPDGPHNAEGMFVVGNEVFIVTRDRTAIVYRGAVPSSGAEIALTRFAELGLTAVTDAELSTDGQFVVVRTGHDAMLYPTADLLKANTLPRVTIPLDGLREPQGEAVALDGSTLYLTSEGRGLWSGSFIRLRCELLN